MRTKELKEFVIIYQKITSTFKCINYGRRQLIVFALKFGKKITPSIIFIYFMWTLFDTQALSLIYICFS